MISSTTGSRMKIGEIISTFVAHARSLPENGSDASDKIDFILSRMANKLRVLDDHTYVGSYSGREFLVALLPAVSRGAFQKFKLVVSPVRYDGEKYVPVLGDCPLLGCAVRDFQNHLFAVFGGPTYTEASANDSDYDEHMACIGFEKIARSTTRHLVKRSG